MSAAADVVADYRSGLKLRTIAQRHGLTRQEVHQVLYDAGALGTIKPASRGVQR